MKNFTIILFILFVCIQQQIKAQEQTPIRNTDISLVDVGWQLSWENNNGSINGKYKMVNNSNKKITIKRIYIHQNNWCFITPYINSHNDSLVLLPFEQKEFTYSCKYFAGRYSSVKFFIEGIANRDKKDNRYSLRIDFNITYYEDNHYMETKAYGGALYLWLENLESYYPDSLIEYLLPYINCEKYIKHKKYLEWSSDDMDIKEWTKMNLTFLEQKVCPCIDNENN